MAQLQLGKQLKDDEVKLIVAFLDSLSGDVPPALAAKPTLPASGPKTPKADPS
jgi:cytochrome c peroxidase